MTQSMRMAKHRCSNPSLSSGSASNSNTGGTGEAAAVELTVPDMQLILSKKFGIHVHGMGLLKPDRSAPPMLGKHIIGGSGGSGGGGDGTLSGMKRRSGGVIMGGSSVHHIAKKAGGGGLQLSNSRIGSVGG